MGNISPAFDGNAVAARLRFDAGVEDQAAGGAPEVVPEDKGFAIIGGDGLPGFDLDGLLADAFVEQGVDLVTRAVAPEVYFGAPASTTI